jgi:hypothetical protein
MEPMETVNTTTNIPINGSINTTTDCLGKVVEPVIPDEQVAIVGSAANRREFGDLASETASAADHHDAEKSIELVSILPRLLFRSLFYSCSFLFLFLPMSLYVSALCLFVSRVA